MNLSSVIEDLIYDKGLDRSKVLEIVSQGMIAAYQAKYPNAEFKVNLLTSKDNISIDVLIKKAVVDVSSGDDLSEITEKKAKLLGIQASVGSEVWVPFTVALGRVDILVAKSSISEAIKKLEQNYIFEIFKNRVGTLVSGTIHKQELSGYAVNLGEAIAFLPRSCAAGITDAFTSGAPVKAIIREVLPFTGKGYQVILDRSAADYVAKLFELVIPEVLEGLVDIVKAERICGYKTKVVVRSRAKNVDPVGACVGMAGSRIKPILAELGAERIDLVSWTDDQELFLRRCLMPGTVEKIIFSADGLSADLVVDDEQKSLIIGKGGGNINLASRLSGIQVRILHDDNFSSRME